MISPKYFIDTLAENGVDFFTGVPDSLLKSICAYLTKNCEANKNIIAANEGASVGLAAGYHLATGKIPVVYMQNSGIGNAVNPILSLVDKEVYNIPLILLIGWRGEPGVKDEPQHIKQGKVTIPLLESIGVKSAVMPREKAEFDDLLQEALSHIRATNEPYAFIIQKDTFEEYVMGEETDPFLLLSREYAIQRVTQATSSSDVIVSTTGMISRELFECRESVHQGHTNDFLTVGSMGHASQIALGVALQQKHRNVFCFDGDGALLMHMGSLGIIGSMKPENLIHIVFNNGAHDSVGGQPTVSFNMDLPQIALSCGYREALSVQSEIELEEVLKTIKTKKGPVFLEIKVKKGARKDLGRPTTTPVQNKEALMQLLRQ